MPLGLFNRYRTYSPSISGWDIRVVPTSGNSRLKSCWSQVVELAESGDSAGTHIVAYHPREDDRLEFQDDVNARHRLIWLTKPEISLYGWPQFDQTLADIAEFEDSWRDQLRPTKTSDALVLPETSFASERLFRGMWRRVQRVHMAADDLDEIEDLITQFDKTYWYQNAWRDAEHRLFKYQGQRHRLLRESKLWKYTLDCPPDFHFDVSAERSADGLRLFDSRTGRTFQFNQYTNVDPHGVVMDGR